MVSENESAFFVSVGHSGERVLPGSLECSTNGRFSEKAVKYTLNDGQFSHLLTVSKLIRDQDKKQLLTLEDQSLVLFGKTAAEFFSGQRSCSESFTGDCNCSNGSSFNYSCKKGTPCETGTGCTVLDDGCGFLGFYRCDAGCPPADVEMPDGPPQTFTQSKKKGNRK